MAKQPATRQKLIDTAVALIGRKGFDAVSTRDVLLAAGQKNQSALQYHFGGREGLMEAAFAHQLERIDRRRQVMVDAIVRDGAEADLKRVVEAIVVPIAREAKSNATGRDYVRFAAQMMTRPDNDVFRFIEHSDLPGLAAVDAMMARIDISGPQQARRLKIRMALMLAMGGVAQWVNHERGRLSYDAMAAVVAGSVVAMLEAPEQGGKGIS